MHTQESGKLSIDATLSNTNFITLCFFLSSLLRTSDHIILRSELSVEVENFSRVDLETHLMCDLNNDCELFKHRINLIHILLLQSINTRVCIVCETCTQNCNDKSSIQSRLDETLQRHFRDWHLKISVDNFPSARADLSEISFLSSVFFFIHEKKESLIWSRVCKHMMNLKMLCTFFAHM